MPITLITGPANAGKAREVLDAVRGHLARGEEPLLLVPTRADVERYRRELALEGAVLGARVERFEGLIGEIVRRAGVSEPVLGRVARERVLAKVVAGGGEDAPRSTPGFVSALAATVAELEVQRVTPARLEAALKAWASADGAGAAAGAGGAGEAVRGVPEAAAADRAHRPRAPCGPGAGRAAARAVVVGGDAGADVRVRRLRRAAARRDRDARLGSGRAGDGVADVRARADGVRGPCGHVRDTAPAGGGAQASAGARRVLRARGAGGAAPPGALAVRAGGWAQRTRPGRCGCWRAGASAPSWSWWRARCGRCWMRGSDLRRSRWCTGRPARWRNCSGRCSSPMESLMPWSDEWDLRTPRSVERSSGRCAARRTRARSQICWHGCDPRACWYASSWPIGWRRRRDARG